MENKEFFSIFPMFGYGVFEEKIENLWSVFRIAMLLVRML
jgi:hypothetical protein